MSNSTYIPPVREIRYLRISLTDRCNFVCPYCRTEAEFHLKKEEISADQIERVVRVFSKYGLRTVRLTGGEPLLRTDVVEIVERISKYGVEVALTTNGFFLEKLAKPLKEAGLKRVNVSLDSLKPEKFRYITGGGDLNKVLKGIETALRAGFETVKLNTVAVKNFTEEEVEDLLLFASEKGLHLRFIELMPVGNLPFHREDRFLPLDLLKEEIEKRFGPLEETDRSGSGASKDFYLPSLGIKVGFIKAITEPFCEGCSKFRLTSDGKIHFCLRTDNEVDLKPYLNSDEDLENFIPTLLRLKTENNLTVMRENFGWLSSLRRMVSLGG